jgi:hypothetical protein
MAKESIQTLEKELRNRLIEAPFINLSRSNPKEIEYEHHHGHRPGARLGQARG